MPRHNEEKPAARSPYPELWTGLLFLGLGTSLLTAAVFGHRLSPALVQLFLELGAMLLVTAAGFLPAFLVARARARGVRARRTVTRRTGKLLSPLLEKLRDAAQRLRLTIVNIDWIGDWLAVAISFVLGMVALLALRKGWLMSARTAQSSCR